MMNLLQILEEKESDLEGGVYHRTQIKFSHHTNRIEGSKLSEEQTRYIYETNTIFTGEDESAVKVDDVMETVNHFVCFDYLLDIAAELLSEQHIKTFHALLKVNTSDAKKKWFQVGDYKSRANEVGGLTTTAPEDVPVAISELLQNYQRLEQVTFSDIVDFHFQFERIHPFQDGNGRVGRLIMFKECLKHAIVPFIIEDAYKFFYYRGLTEYPNVKEYLIDTCLSAQDDYQKGC